MLNLWNPGGFVALIAGINHPDLFPGKANKINKLVTDMSVKGEGAGSTPVHKLKSKKVVDSCFNVLKDAKYYNT